MNTMISLASSEDVKSVGILYDNVNEYFEKNVNYCYPNWQKGKYPTIADAQRAFVDNINQEFDVFEYIF